MPSSAKNKNAIKKFVKDLQTDLNREAKRQNLSFPVQADVDFNNSPSLGYTPILNSHPASITNNNFDNRGATIGAIGNDNIVIQNISNPQMQELIELISKSKNDIEALDIEDEEKEWLTHNIDSCQAEVESSAPKLSLIKRFTSTIINELEMIKDSFISASKEIAPITAILVNIPRIFELAKDIFGT